MKKICAWCCLDMGNIDDKNDNLISHGICLTCKIKVLADMDNASKTFETNLNLLKTTIQGISLPLVNGHALANDHWHVYCPSCSLHIEFTGYFDSGDICTCPNCKTQFKIKAIVFTDGSHIA